MRPRRHATRRRPTLAVVLLTLWLGLPAVAAVDVQFDALTAERVNTTFHDGTGPAMPITFETSYLNVNVSNRDVFVPEALQPCLSQYGYQKQTIERPGRNDTVRFRPTIRWHRAANSNCWDGLPNATAAVLGHGWWYDQPTTVITGTRQHHSRVFDGRFRHSDGTLSVNVASHYEHLLFNYTLTNSTGHTVWQTQDVYSGEEPERVTFSADVDQVTNSVLRQNITYDNRYDGRDHELLHFIYEANASIQTIDWRGLNHSVVNVSYQNVSKPALQTAGVNDSLVLESLDGLQQTTYNVSFPADSRRTVQTTYRYQSRRERNNRLTLLPDRTFWSYIVGSGGAVKVTGSQTLCNDVTNGGQMYDTIEISGTVNVCDVDNGGSGKLNLTAHEWINVTGSGTINGNGRGHSGAGSTGSSNEVWNDGSSGSGTGAGGGGESGSASIEEAAGGGGAGYGSGGSSGGDAGDSNGGGGGGTYNDATAKELVLGSGGGAGAAGDGATGGGGGDGGGAVLLKADDTIIDGTVTMDGGNGGDGSCSCDDEDAAGGGGGGSGGTILVEAFDLNIAGSLSTTGGGGGSGATFNEPTGSGGNGGGGRIKLFWQYNYTNTSQSANDGGGTYYQAQENLGFDFNPLFNGTTFRRDDRRGVTRVEFGLDDGGERDLRTWQGDGAVHQFTNDSLQVDVTLPFGAVFTVTDRADLVTPSTNVTVRQTDSGLRTDDAVSTPDTQRTNRTVTLTNVGDQLDYNLTLDQHGTPVNDTWNGTLATGASVTHTGEWTFDEVVQAGTTRSFTRIVDDKQVTVTLNQSYTVTNQLPLPFMDVQFNYTAEYNASYWGGPALKTVNVSNDTSGFVDITATATPLPEVSPPSCPSGYADFGSYCKQEASISGGTRYSYLQYLKPRTDDIANESVIHAVGSDRLLSWADRSNVTAWVNGSQTNVTWTADGSGVNVTIGDNYGDSSVHKGTLYVTKVEYDDTGGGDDDSSGDPSGGGGGTGGGGGGPSDPAPDLLATFDHPTVYAAPYTRTTDRELTVINTANQENTIQIEKDTGAICQYVRVQRTVNSDQFGDTGTYRIAERTAGLASGKTEATVNVRFDLPDEQTWQRITQGVNASCTFTTQATAGAAEPLTVRVEPGLSFAASVNRWFINTFGPWAKVFRSNTVQFGIDQTAVDGNATGGNTSLQPGAGQSDRGFHTDLWPVWPMGVLLYLLLTVAGIGIVWYAVRT